MFSLLGRLGGVGVSRPLVASRIATTLSRRTFLTSPAVAFPAAVRPPAKAKKVVAAPAKKPAAKKGAAAKKPAAKPAKKVAPKKKVVAKKKAASKKKAAPKKKPKRRVVPKKVVKKPARVTKAQGPPSRGASPFLVFAREYRKNKTGDTIQLSKDAGVAWHALSESEKQPYHAASVAERAAAAEAIAHYFNTVDPSLLRRLNAQRRAQKKPRIVNPAIPKKPPGAYVAWTLDQPPSPPGTSFIDRGRQLGAAWNALSEAEKAPYRARWEEQIAAHRLKYPAA